jgi:putative ABC transport system ATP-binding protein
LVTLRGASAESAPGGRFDDPDEGSVLLDGRDVRDYDVLQLRRRVQSVSQVPVTFPGTVTENILLGLDTRPVGDLLERVGLAPALADREADRLSVGEAQRMALARALAREPEVLLLDEPTAALDATSKGGVERLVRQLADEGLTVVMVSHDQAQLSLADHVISVTPS